MAQSTLSIRMDEELKKDFDMMCNDFGMNISTAVTIFAKKVVAEKKIPFEITSNDDYGFYSEQNMAHLRESIAQFERGEGIVKTMEELEAMTNE